MEKTSQIKTGSENASNSESADLRLFAGGGEALSVPFLSPVKDLPRKITHSLSAARGANKSMASGLVSRDNAAKNAAQL